MTGTEYLTQLNKASMLCLIIGLCFLVLTVILCFALRIPHIIRTITGRAMKREIRRHMRGMSGVGDVPYFFGSLSGGKDEGYWNTTSGGPKPNDDSGETLALTDGSDDETDILPENMINTPEKSVDPEETSVLEDGERSIVLLSSDKSLI